jgi:hypothetical protein
MEATEEQKKQLIVGSIIPDTVRKTEVSHNKVKSEIPMVFIANPEYAEKFLKEFLSSGNWTSLGIYLHLQLDYLYMTKFIIPQFDWDKSTMTIAKKGDNSKRWKAIEEFWNQKSKNSIYYEYKIINQRLIKEKKISSTDVKWIENLPKTGHRNQDMDKDPNWKSELESFFEYDKNIENQEMRIIDYDEYMRFINTMIKRMTLEIIEKRTEYLRKEDAFYGKMIIKGMEQQQ